MSRTKTPVRPVVVWANRMRLGAKEEGFSLIELLIVVAIILIVAAIAIPNFMRARIAANEASAVSSCRTINSAEINYNSYYQQGFSSTLAQLGPPTSGQADTNHADMIDDVLASSVKSGYTFAYTPTNPNGARYDAYQLNANPSTPQRSGSRYFYSDPSGLIRVAYNAEAGPSDSPID